ncbi:unnamed protein product, partial [Musa acuminata var. zebrina]
MAGACCLTLRSAPSTLLGIQEKVITLNKKGQEFERTWCSEQHAILMSTGCSSLQLLAESGVWPDRCFFVYLQRFFFWVPKYLNCFMGVW